MDKRSFIKNLGVMSAALSVGFTRLQEAVAAVEHVPVSDLAGDEEFWLKVRGVNKNPKTSWDEVIQLVERVLKLGDWVPPSLPKFCLAEGSDCSHSQQRQQRVKEQGQTPCITLNPV